METTNNQNRSFRPIGNMEPLNAREDNPTEKPPAKARGSFTNKPNNHCSPSNLSTFQPFNLLPLKSNKPLKTKKSIENEPLKKAIQHATKLAYDLQEKRIALSNEITHKFRARRGSPTWDTKDPIYGEEEDPKSMETLILVHKSGKEPGGIIPTQEENSKLENYLHLKKEEEEAFEAISPFLSDLTIYKEFLIKEMTITIGTMGILIGWFDIQRAPFPSSFWSYAGLNPPKKAEPKKLSSFEFLPPNIGDSHNPYVKAKLVSILGKSLLQDKSQWNKVFNDYKSRAEAKKEKTFKSRSHLHNMALRYTIKEFLKAFHLAWRRAEGLPEPEVFQKVQTPEEMEQKRKKASQ